jgi:hypothetical protein
VPLIQSLLSAGPTDCLHKSCAIDESIVPILLTRLQSSTAAEYFGQGLWLVYSKAGISDSTACPTTCFSQGLCRHFKSGEEGRKQ